MAAERLLSRGQNPRIKVSVKPGPAQNDVMRLHGEPDWFECRVEPRRNVVYVAPVGELDITTAPELEALLRDLRGIGFDLLVLDLRETRFIDSGGLHLALNWNERARRENFGFSLVQGPDAVRRIFDVAGVTGTLRFVDDTDVHL
jgi:anti-anti-sigma factor